MDLDEYQRFAELTDQTPGDDEFRTALQVLALQSKVGDLSGLFKKYYRKQLSRSALEAGIDRSLGDILWYLSSVASSSNLSLNRLAEHNLVRVQRRYGDSEPGLFDPMRSRLDSLKESFPQRLTFDFHCFEDLTGQKIMQVRVIGPNGFPVGDDIDDNEYQEDHYRFHDALHIAYMVFLGWSPVMRKLLAVKRKSSELLDRIEDGAKARDIEEALTRRIFQYYIENQFMVGMNEVDTDLLTEIPNFLGGREASWLAEAQWEITIISAAKIIRALIENNGGRVIANLEERSIKFEKLKVK